MRIGVDAMGGDHAPGAVVEGALAARSILPAGDTIVLVGDEAAIAGHLEKDLEGAETDGKVGIEVRHASQAVGMHESPVVALRAKPNSSMAVLAQMHADKEVEAIISAGNTGAWVAAAQMRLRRLPGVHRPGICILSPTLHGPVAICDVGANLNCRPLHLHQYGTMASVYLTAACGVENPRVGLLSIGEEDAKGTDLVKLSRELMKEDTSLNFIGNIEGRDLFNGACDVVVCDGFVCNVVLKLMEGMAEAVLRGIIGQLAESMSDKSGAVLQAGRELLNRYDSNEYGGAPLLGVGGICLICHGASSSRGIMNAIRKARQLVEHEVNQCIIDLISADERTLHA